VRPGDIVVAGKNFGVGSSRPVAALFRQLKVAALVAEEFNSLFLRNAINSGLPALTVPGATQIFSDGDTARINIATGDYTNESTGASGKTAPLPPSVQPG
jgi:3-isopropylmalate/(R)-2-methylmalate dehydratase small subunit